MDLKDRRKGYMGEFGGRKQGEIILLYYNLTKKEMLQITKIK